MAIFVRCAAACAAVLSLCCACDRSTPAPPTVRGVAYVRYLGQGRSDVWLTRLDRGRRLIARNADGPILSPDGRWIAYARCVAADYCGDVYLASTDGAERRLLARRFEAGAWTPDSKRLIGWRPSHASRRALVRVDVRDGTVTRLVDRAVERFAVSPSGREVCVVINRRGHLDLYVVGTDGGRVHRLTSGGVSDFPVWGRYGIAFSRQVRRGTLPHNAWGADEIWSIDPGGGGSRRIARPPAHILGSGITGLAPIAWSRDGRRIVAALLNEFGGPPYSVNARTGAVRRIGSYGYTAWPFGLSRDGRSVLVEDRKYERLDRSQRVEIVPYAGGPPVVVARFAGSPTWNG
jgi:Tol biopolymer transport system component